MSAEASEQARELREQINAWNRGELNINIGLTDILDAALLRERNRQREADAKNCDTARLLKTIEVMARDGAFLTDLVNRQKIVLGVLMQRQGGEISFTKAEADKLPEFQIVAEGDADGLRQTLFIVKNRERIVVAG